MDFALSPEQLQLADVTGEFFASYRGAALARAALQDPSLALPNLRPALADLGLLGLLDGGPDAGTVLDLAVIAEQSGRALAPAPLISTAAWAIPVLNDAARDGSDGAAKLLEEAAAGKTAVAAADPDASTVLDGAEASAVLSVQGGRLVSIDPTTPGVRRTGRAPADPTRGLARVDLTVPGTVLWDDPNGVRDAWARGRYTAMITLAAECCGLVGACLDLAVAYAREREAFGRFIGSFQAVKHSLVEVYVHREQLRSLVWLAAWMADEQPELIVRYALGALAFASDAAKQASDTLIQVHGGIGVTWEHDAHLYWRRARVDRALFGEPAELRARLADELLEGGPCRVR
jgi:alkylation response protein AidB-like acyl-CoA dehydrogenase